nr:MAG TPA: hypothetical protein [Caudoviricetes sp.]
MSKAVMLSIRPQWCEKIASGKKTIEVRKTRPKLATPFKAYLYVTAGNLSYRCPNGMICHCNGGRAVIGEFTCDRIYELAPLNHAPDDVEQQACLTWEEIVNYLKGTGYGWHISDLRIYDAPRELSEFERPYECNECDAKWATECNACHEEGKIKRAPQSWCYVEAMDNG